MRMINRKCFVSIVDNDVDSRFPFILLPYPSINGATMISPTLESLVHFEGTNSRAFPLFVTRTVIRY